MKNRLIIFLMVLLPCSGQIITGPQVNAKLIAITQLRIESLYQYHDKRAALPTESSNPFRPEDRLSGIAFDSSSGGGIEGQSSNQNAALLDKAVGAITISGVVNRGGEMQIVANGLIYKAGTIILVHVGADTVFVRVMKITEKKATFRLGESELTVRL